MLAEQSKKLTKGLASCGHLSWSLDGNKIAFMSGRDGNPEIYVMNADGTEQRRLTNSLENESEPFWSPLILEGKDKKN